MTTTLTLAKEQLFTRPPEEHFESFACLRENAAQQRTRCREIEARDLAVLFGESGDLYMGDHAVAPTHYSMSQLAAIARVPMALLERLEPLTRASVLNQCYERSRRLRIGLADGNRLRAVTSDRYERVWDSELYETIDRWLLPSGFIPALPTMNTDALGTNIRGNTKPALFRSDRDSFAFFYSEETPRDAFGGLRKGVVVFNSEVGAKSLGYCSRLGVARGRRRCSLPEQVGRAEWGLPSPIDPRSGTTAVAVDLLQCLEAHGPRNRRGDVGTLGARRDEPGVRGAQPM